jgi:hypothetical protein
MKGGNYNTVKKVSVKWTTSRNPTNCLYPGGHISFAWLTAPTKKGLLSIASGWHGCRETFTQELCKLSKKSPNAPTKMDLSRVRIAVARKHAIKKTYPATSGDIPKPELDIMYEVDVKWMKESVRLLNIMEKSQGWALSQVKECVDPDYYNTGVVMFVFTSSCKWMRSSQLLSLYLLIIRLGYFWDEFSNFGEIGDLEAVAKKFSDEKHYYSGNSGIDRSWFLKTWKNWEPLLDNHRKLFFERSMLSNYSVTFGNMGIDALERLHADGKTSACWQEIKAAA